MPARIDPAALPFIGGALAVALALGLAGVWLAAAPFVILAGFFLFFFRDPDRLSPTNDDAVLSPADGRWYWWPVLLSRNRPRPARGSR